mmetsp:Transcript_6308/g.9166  ORF Transcript_6308/g.9166 Transcript_6308/m.9166 type:complete len:352 (-) Transcript_6308:505-1560(-)|eukprot:CAMPEP_0184871174 /NCGR_PEP_ID=MMETSP0580-20130426/40276_1 /TAXON_ID=1118495 /ORGANISM="Dactyliosolen fragilissimus" /LENGTH=351 /DNA_ID=CAMNT_0027373743 /DNA_START=88 /DNA_END=1143 /DNA_ORIENTATION=+
MSRSLSLSSKDEDVGSLAARKVEIFISSSNFFDAVKESEIPRHTIDELEVGKFLGKGCFSHVYEARLKKSAKSSESRTYAIKYLSKEAMDNKKLFRIGAVDLAIEALYLSCLDHKNIIKLHGVPAGDISANFSPRALGKYFLLLDRLECTLQHMLLVWKETEEKASPRVSIFKKKKGDYGSTTLPSRVLSCLSIASGLQHLHKHKIMYRDLKPDNIGFSVNKTLKIFDFGLAKEIAPTCPSEFRHTKMTGSLRYMAPEVARGLPYGLLADVYSVGVLSWQICALEEPYQTYESFHSFMDGVVYNMDRPDVKKIFRPQSIAKLVDQCWVSSSSDRPSIDFVVTILTASYKNV